MTDLDVAMALAGELKQNGSARRVTAVNNIVQACHHLLEQKQKINVANVVATAKALGLKGPAASSIYNAEELGTLVQAFAKTQKVVPDDTMSRALSSDEDELLAAIVNPRLKSMLRDLIADRNKAKQEIRILDNFVRKVKSSDLFLGQTAAQENLALEKQATISEAEKQVVRHFFEETLDGYGFELESDDLCRSGRPIGARQFVALMRKLTGGDLKC
ncbi:gamma-mobile-trio protein GmtX [Ruegeria atlantica]|uniref:gamma-mobile-trio protein GmtX n=1 Tax=Ruegeria atlantica TaxID=81569 RepID=UPI0024957981|nr:gamma-mobile-trio protein GmtX [Ruegeria atlantica]